MVISTNIINLSKLIILYKNPTLNVIYYFNLLKNVLYVYLNNLSILIEIWALIWKLQNYIVLIHNNANSLDNKAL